ncbi:MAG: ATP-binding cassette domain-containing protein [Candidatus Neomarinimicrobiota bacterium]
MTEFSFTIRFPKFDTSSARIALRPGIHLIYGESGVGKSRLCREIFSVSDPAEMGTFLLERPTLMQNPMLVMQDPDDQIVSPTVLRELAFNMENEGWDSRHIGSEVRRIANTFDFPWGGDRHPNSLSGGEKELLNLATALSVRPDLLVIDDGLAFLSQRNKEKVAEILNAHCRNENAVVLWFTSDVRDLKNATSYWELRLDRLISGIVDSSPLNTDYSPPRGKLVMEIDRLSFRYDGAPSLFSDQTIRIGPFRSLAVLGENGCGKSTLGNLIAGMESPLRGHVTLSAGDGRRPQKGLLPQLPERLFGGRTFDEVLEELTQGGLFEPGKKKLFRHVLREFQISWEILRHKQIHREKISVVRVALVVLMLLANYDLVVLDEPTFSLGENQKAKLIEFIRGCMTRKHLVLISHSKRIARALCNEAVCIEDGVIKKMTLRSESLHHAGKSR